MKHSLKFCRFSLVLLLALTVAFSAAVGVSADTIPIELYALKSRTEWDILQLNNQYQAYSYSNIGFNINIPLQQNNSYIITVTINGTDIPEFYTGTINYAAIDKNTIPYSPYVTSEAFNNRGIKGASIINYSYNSNGVTYVISFNADDISYIDTNQNYYLSYLFDSISGVLYATITSVQAVEISNQNPSEITLDDINNKLNTVIGNQNSNQFTLSQILQENININNNITQIINYGSNYNQIDQTIINNLGSTEDQLSSAEGAIEEKSKSLMQQASAGISKATTASQTLVTSLTTTIPTVYTFASDIIEVTPPEVQAAVLAIPLLSFAVWLIGLRR